MNSYELSRAFCDWCFENPHKVKPIHYAIYFFAIEHCNRLGWKTNFGLPSQMVMEAIGVKNWRTYSSGLNDLVDFGFVKMIETSKNQYSSNIVAIVKNTKAHTKALDKALSKHTTKQSQSTVSIDKQYNNITSNNITSDEDQKLFLFECFWNAYNKKTGKDKALKKWKSLSIDLMQSILDIIPTYVKSTPDVQYRKDPTTYLNGKCWEDEIIFKTIDKNTTNEQLREFTTRARELDPSL